MAEIQPLRALHYNTSVVGPLDDVVAPPYDVIDAEQRAQLIARSPFNVVAVDLPQGDPDPYESARELFDTWQLQGALVRDREPALWVHTQEYDGPGGKRLTRRGFFCRVRIEGYGPGRVRPHERTHPGPKEDRLRLTRTTRANLSPIFSLYSDPQDTAWAALEPATEQAPWAEISDADGTIHRLWPDAALRERSEPYRRLDTGILEALILKGTLGLSDDDISHFKGLFYARDAEEAVAMVTSGEYDAAFLMRPTPVGQMRDLAAADENMPPKSTYFFPKLLTGLLFNPLS